MNIVKKIQFVDLPSGAKLNEPLPDGIYAQIFYNNQLVGIANVPNPFPWTTVVFAFESGEARELGTGSDPGQMILDFGVTKVFFVGLEDKQKYQIGDKLMQKGIELIPD